MPYASEAQARKFHADPRLRRYAAEFDAATDFRTLPNRVPRNRPKHVLRDVYGHKRAR